MGDMTSRDIRQHIGHPVVDGDGHLVEHMGVFREFLGEQGPGAVDRFEQLMVSHPPRTQGDAHWRDPKATWWGFSNNTYDRATVSTPGLMAARMEEFGIDFSVLYPTFGLHCLTLPDPQVRQDCVRAMNRMNAELCRPFAAQLTPVAVIPMHTPEEAVEELRYATEELGAKAAVIPAAVARPIPALEHYQDAFPAASYMDCFGLDSPYDYDPLWREFTARGVAVTCHGASGNRYLPAGRQSPSNYMFNHVGAHAYQQAEICRSLFFGGVTNRFPQLNFAFLEGGVTWAIQMLVDLIEHWEKRNIEAVYAYDPSKLDPAEFQRLLQEYGTGRIADMSERYEHDKIDPMPYDTSIKAVDEWADAGIATEEDVVHRLVDRCYFGVESDDRGIAWAFASKVNAKGAVFKAMFSSDIGHWDVRDPAGVVADSYGLLEKELITEADFRKLVFENPVGLHHGMNPAFFDGTTVADALTQAQPA